MTFTFTVVYLHTTKECVASFKISKLKSKPAAVFSFNLIFKTPFKVPYGDKISNVLSDTDL